MSDDRPVVQVETTRALEDLMAVLARSPRVGVDTEANAFHAYRERVCLIQISTEATDYVVDPLAVDVGPLGDLFADPGRETIFHAAEYDVSSMKRDFGFAFEAIFDTQAAAMVLGSGQVGLAGLVEQYFGIRLPKGETRSNWGRRPLTPAQLDYAATDTRYLLRLQALLAAELEAAGRLDEAKAQFARVAATDPHTRPFDPEGFYKIKGYRDLDAPGRGALRALYLAREARAAEIDRPPFKVMGNDVLLRLAELRPGAPRDLDRVRGVPAPVKARWAGPLLEAVRAGAADPEPPPKRRPRRPEDAPDPEALARFEQLRTWRKEKAASRGIEAQIIVTSGVLKAIADARPRTLEALRAVPGVDDWAAAVYGAEILQALEG